MGSVSVRTLTLEALRVLTAVSNHYLFCFWSKGIPIVLKIISHRNGAESACTCLNVCIFMKGYGDGKVSWIISLYKNIVFIRGLKRENY